MWQMLEPSQTWSVQSFRRRRAASQQVGLYYAFLQFRGWQLTDSADPAQAVHQGRVVFKQNGHHRACGQTL